MRIRRVNAPYMSRNTFSCILLNQHLSAIIQLKSPIDHRRNLLNFRPEGRAQGFQYGTVGRSCILPSVDSKNFFQIIRSEISIGRAHAETIGQFSGALLTDMVYVDLELSESGFPMDRTPMNRPAILVTDAQHNIKILAEEGFPQITSDGDFRG